MGDKTHFGYEKINIDEKITRVGQVFSSVAKNYDVMNDLMSGGLHRLWKRQAIRMLNPRPGHTVLDLAGGTGDLSRLITPKVGESGQVVLADINADMLAAGRDRLIDSGTNPLPHIVQTNAEALCFPDQSFDRCIIGFGLRNVTHKDRALKEMARVLKPGGMLIILEFSKPHSPALNKLYDFYSFKALPRMGEWVANDADSYRYLAESIRMHPNQETLKTMMQDAGFARCSYQNLLGGIVALHQGYVL